MTIVLGNDFEYIKENGSIYASLCINFENIYFPDKQWTDFIYPVLDWWSNEFINAYKYHMHMKLLFMDGTYSMIGNINEKELKLECFNNYLGQGNALEEMTCEAAVFRNELVKSLRKCYRIFSDENDIALNERCNKQITLLSGLII